MSRFLPGTDLTNVPQWLLTSEGAPRDPLTTQRGFQSAFTRTAQSPIPVDFTQQGITEKPSLMQNLGTGLGWLNAGFAAAETFQASMNGTIDQDNDAYQDLAEYERQMRMQQYIAGTGADVPMVTGATRSREGEGEPAEPMGGLMMPLLIGGAALAAFFLLKKG